MSSRRGKDSTNDGAGSTGAKDKSARSDAEIVGILSPELPDTPARPIIHAIVPSVDGGRYPAKRAIGDRVIVEADIVLDGHDKLGARLLVQRPGSVTFEALPFAPMGPTHPDRYRGAFTVDEVGMWRFTVEAWVDQAATWRWGLERKFAAGQDVTLELRDGARLTLAARARAGAHGDAARLDELGRALTDASMSMAARVAQATQPDAVALLARWPDLAAAERHPALDLTVEPTRARFSSWYELFPRSTGTNGQHGTFRDVARRLPDIADMGFDVLYLPPIHPIGHTHRKGPNNALHAGPSDPGSPWAIGGPEGGHKAVHPQLGTLADFRALVDDARARGIEVALDIAFQASPDHPYVREHPDWFIRRADDSIQYAENPPKKYQDVFPFDFGSADWKALWEELASVFLFWCEQGVRIFRVDNPHTKPVPFWRWCLARVRARYPDTVFLSEAFTRPKVMYALAKAGFSQSYTYFTWRTSGHELTEYVTEITRPEIADFFRPAFWPNTPDILPEHLQFGTRGTFIARLILAGTLTANYGIYGPPFELMERTPREGAEEYVDNEKFQLRAWDLDRPGNLRPVIKRLNRIRRDNPALQANAGIVFHRTDNDLLLAYSKSDDAGDNTVLVVVNLDPHHAQAGWLTLDLAGMGIAADEPFQVHDLLGDARYLWNGPRAFVNLDPEVMPAHIFAVKHRHRSERTFEYFF